MEEKIHEQFRTHIYGWVSQRLDILPDEADVRHGRTRMSM